MDDEMLLSKEELLATDFDLEIEEEDQRNNLGWAAVSDTWVLVTG